jgi:hypothetical protein
MHLRLAISLERTLGGHTRHSAPFAILPIGAERAVERSVIRPSPGPSAWIGLPGLIMNSKLSFKSSTPALVGLLLGIARARRSALPAAERPRPLAQAGQPRSAPQAPAGPGSGAWPHDIRPGQQTLMLPGQLRDCVRASERRFGRTRSPALVADDYEEVASPLISR